VIEAPADAVWAQIRDFNGLPKWTPFVAESRIEGGLAADKVGCIRNFRLKDGGVIREQLLTLSDYDFQCSYAILESPMGVENYVSTLKLTPVTDGNRTFAEWWAEFECAPERERALSEQIGRDANLVMSGQIGYGNGAPQSLRALTTAHAGNNHRVSVAMGYGRFTFSRHSATPRLGQFSVSATDTWQVSGPVLIVYGLEFARFDERGSGTSVLPRFGIALDAGARTRVFAGLVPGSSSDTQSKVNLESGEVEFSEPKPVATAGGQPVMERSYRLEFGGEQILSDKSSLEVMAFLDTVSGHGVGLLSIPNDASQAEPAIRSEEQSGRTRGLRVVYHRHVNKVIDGSVGDLHMVRITSRDPAPPPIPYIKVSGGIFLDMMIHDFDMARFITGSEVVDVYAQGAVRVDPAIGEAGDLDTAVVMLRHDNGCITTIDNSRQAVYGYDQRVEAFGSGGLAASENPLNHTGIRRSAAGTISQTRNTVGRDEEDSTKL
jgi:hypothetical protein